MARKEHARGYRMRDFWQDWADTTRARDFRWGGPTCLTDLQKQPLARVTIMHVRAHDPKQQQIGEYAGPLSDPPPTPPARWAPERYSIAWEPAALRFQPRLLKYRVISYTTMN